MEIKKVLEVLGKHIKQLEDEIYLQKFEIERLKEVANEKEIKS